MSGFSSAYVISIIGSWLFNRLWRESQQLCLNAQILALDNPTSSHCEVSHKGIGEGQVGGDIISHEDAHGLDFTMVFLLVLSSFFWCVLCACACVHVCTCACRNQRLISVSPQSLFIVFFKQGISVSLELTYWSDWLAASSGFCLPLHIPLSMEVTIPMVMLCF